MSLYPNYFFISDKLRIILSKIDSPYSEKLLNYTNDEDCDDKKWINFLDVAADDSTKISYLDKERYKSFLNSTSFESFFDSNKRYTTSMGKLFNKLEIEIEEPGFSNFYNEFKVLSKNDNIESLYHLDFVKGSDLLYWYNEDNYYPSSGSLSSSCMRYSRCEDYLEFYSYNYDKITMFIATNQNLLVGRCLIWDDKYFDRIYAIDQYTELQISMYLKSKEYIDVYNSVDSITIPLKKGYGSFEYYPYCDTFKYLSYNSISNYDRHDYILELTCSEGNCQDDHVILYDTGRAVHIDEACYVSYLDGYAMIDDCVYSKCSSEHILRKDAVLLYDGDYLHETDTILLYDGTYACKHDYNLIELHNGEYAIHDDSVIALYDGTYAIDCDTVELENGEYALYNDKNIVKNEDGKYSFISQDVVNS